MVWNVGAADKGGDAAKPSVDERGEAVVVAEAYLGGGHRVVLVDDGDAAEFQQGAEGGAGVEVAAAVLAVLQGEQELGVGL